MCLGCSSRAEIKHVTVKEDHVKAVTELLVQDKEKQKQRSLIICCVHVSKCRRNADLSDVNTLRLMYP